MLLYLFYILLLSAFASAKIDVRELKCLVCKVTFDELNVAINKLDPDLQMEIGGYKIDHEGNLKRKTVSQTQSEVALSETIEDICEKMEDYVRATYKSNGKLTLLKMVLSDGSMNPDMSIVDFIQDDDLNKSLKYYCEEILEMYEDAIIKNYINNKDTVKHKMCIEETKYCDTLEDTDKNETENEEVDEDIKNLEKILQEERDEL
ncbi:protein seele [Onthophagus taurus]|uniref:protein seele n=1 Tax=Onthophagus taurus TaxID=166361 RepID=UPI000C1FDF4E|nr:protein seele [Onthophagus taurus]